MAARTKSKVTPKYKTKYRVTNWPAYEASLRKRGDVTLWFDEEAILAWNAAKGGTPGGQRTYSNLAILTAMTLRTVFRLPLRQTEGFVASLIALMGLELDTPDHTTLSRRGRDVEVPMPARSLGGAVHLVIDSTGLKMMGDGEWHAHKHRTSNRRRSWRKLHLGVDEQGFILAWDLTGARVDDSPIGVSMLEELDVTIKRFTAYGAYDSRAIYQAVAKAGTPDVTVVVPPSRRAAVDPAAVWPWDQRNAAIERIAEVGRRQWRKESGAHRQARAENAMFRYKRIIGDGLRSRSFNAQTREAMVAVRVLNRMTQLGKPSSVAIQT
ncbi:MAG TPA: IS5 family transposase [Myxococcota bacterium]|nr:IS5 family transposase [Myxococcota bacterium]